jgi:hypothetical protein
LIEPKIFFIALTLATHESIRVELLNKMAFGQHLPVSVAEVFELIGKMARGELIDLSSVHSTTNPPTRFDPCLLNVDHRNLRRACFAAGAPVP